MSERAQQLQHRIEQLEAGMDLSASLIGLPEEEANALALIDALRNASVEEMDGEQRRAQRAAVLEAAEARLNGGAVSSTAPSFAPLELIKNIFQGRWTAREFSFGMAILLGIAVIAVTWLGIAQNREKDQIAEEPAIIIEDEVAADPEQVEPAVVDTTSGTESEPAAVEDESDIAAGPAAGDETALFLPVLSSTPNLTPQSARVEVSSGVVEVQESAGEAWVLVNKVTTVAAGARLRTAALSQATITFYDGSQATLAAGSELSIDQLDAQRPADGFRTVVMTQWVGESEHAVDHRGDNGSLYEVKTPTGSGVARGTRFRVVVSPTALVRYIVTEGKVDVSGQNRTVAVIAGQRTIILAGSAPAEPQFNIFGEGEVTAVGPTWTIAGQTFQTDDTTLIVGNPQIGDLVQVSGHLRPEGSRQADVITLIRRALVNRFALSGEVTVMGDMWEVAGQIIVVDDDTVVDETIAIGDQVRVSGVLLAGGTLQAESIVQLDDTAGLPFAYSGVVEALSDDSVTISGQTVVLGDGTMMPGDLGVGNVVMVSGTIAPDGRWLAGRIERRSSERAVFEFSGAIESLEPWRVAGINFETRDWSMIPADLEVGDRVMVRGTILPDGTRVADVILAIDEQPTNLLTIIGIVGSIDPWIINGVPLNVLGTSRIIGEVTVGATVLVQTRLLAGGRWEIVEVRPLHTTYGLGCLTLSSPIVVVEAQKFKLKHWEKFIDRGKLPGNLKVNSVVTLPLCSGIDGQIEVIGRVIIIYQPVVFIIDDGVDVIPSGCRVNSKGSLKCSNKSSKKSSK